MKDAKVNYIAVVAAAVLYWLLGAAWFTVFSRQWLAGIGKTAEQLQQQQGKESPVPYIVALICNLVLAYALAWFVSRTGEQTAARGMKLGSFLWVGLIATTMATELAFEGRSAQFFAISAGYPLVGLLLMGAVLGGWKKKESAPMARKAEV